MKISTADKLIDLLDKNIEPIAENNYANLLEKIGDARFVLMGEASHGTQEFYQTRIEITQQLITQKEFMAVTIEGDWPDVYQIHRYLQGKGNDPLKSLDAFTRFPTWMWRNETMLFFLTWLRRFNDPLSSTEKIGFYGLDLYSLNTSMQAVIDYLKKVDPEAAERAKKRYACFDHVNLDPETYGYLVASGVKDDCIKETVEQLLELEQHAFQYLKKDGLIAKDEFFYLLQNARLVKNAENYYRNMFEGTDNSWNLRDKHMAETFNEILSHLEDRSQKPAKIIVWAHNSHIGDARATEMGIKGEFNIGQLIREQYPTDTYSIGFSTYQGTVTAASDWGLAPETKKINPGLAGSYEALFHQLKRKNFLLDLRKDKNLEHYLKISRLQRAIGVIYRPETERDSHYFFTRLPYQFNCLIHFDKTTAVKPISF